MAYEVLLDPSVVERADEIVDYLSCVLASPSAATTFLDGLDELVGRLETLPFSYPHPRDAVLSQRGYRKALVGRYIVLFRVEESFKGSGIVYVTNIFHGSQNYQDLL